MRPHWRRSRLEGSWVEELLLELIPGVGSFQTSETGHRLSTAGRPAYAGSFEAVLDKMATGVFNHARCNRNARCQIFVILHATCLRREIATRCIYVGALLF